MDIAFVKHYMKGTGFTVIVLGADRTFFPVIEAIYVGMHILLSYFYFTVLPAVFKQIEFIYNIVVLHTRV
jgi:hypothetical protein